MGKTPSPRYYIGIGLQYDLPNNFGAQVISVMPGGPADKAGVKAGQYITAVNGEKVGRVGNYESAATMPEKKLRKFLTDGPEGSFFTMDLANPDKQVVIFRETIDRAKWVPLDEPLTSGNSVSDGNIGFTSKVSRGRTGEHFVYYCRIHNDSASEYWVEWDIVSNILGKNTVTRLKPGEAREFTVELARFPEVVGMELNTKIYRAVAKIGEGAASGYQPAH